MSLLRRTALGAVALATAVSLAACGADSSSGSTDSTRSVTHAQGTTSVPTNPKKVFVVDRAALDIADAFGVEVAGVSKQAMPDYLKKFTDDKYFDVGQQKEPDFEKIGAQGPDLVVVGGRSAATYGEMSKIAPTVDMTDRATTHMEILKNQTTLLGKTFGKDDVAKSKLAEVQAQFDETKKTMAPKAGTALVVIVSGGKVSAFGPGSRFGLIYDLGFTPAATIDNKDRHGQVVSFEFIAKADPEWLFVIDRDKAIGKGGGAPAEKVMDNALVNGTKAAKKHQVVMLDGQNWYAVGGGLTNTVEMLKQVSGASNS